MRQAGDDVVDERFGERQFLVGFAFFAQRAAHEGAVVGRAAEHHFGQDGLVQLDEADARGQQKMQFFAQDADDVFGQCFARVVGAVRDALHPHRTGQQVRAGQGDLDRRLGQFGEKRGLVHGQRAAPAQRAEHRGMSHLAGRHVQGAQFALEFFRVVHVGQQVGDRNQLAVVQQAADEAGVVVAALFAVREDADAGALLRGHGQADRIVRGLGEFVVRQATFEMVVERAQQPRRPRPASDAHHGQRGDGRCGLRVRESVGNDDFCNGLSDGRVFFFAGTALAAAFLLARGRGRFGGLGRFRRQGGRSFGDEEAVLGSLLDVGHEVVAGQPTPRGQVFDDRRFGGQDFEQLAGRQRVDVLADEQQEPVAAVEVATVEAVRWLVGVLSGHGTFRFEGSDLAVSGGVEVRGNAGRPSPPDHVRDRLQPSPVKRGDGG